MAAHQLVVYAVDWSRELGDGKLGTEHLLLAATREGASVGTAIVEAGATTEKLIGQLGRDVTPLTEPKRRGSRQIPFTPNAKQAMREAIAEADRLDSAAVQPSHLMLGVLNVATSTGVRLLTELGVNLEELRVTLVRSRAHS